MITTRKMAAIALTAATMISGMALTGGTAYAAADKNAANDITVSSQNGNDSTVTGRTFTAYKLGSYKDVEFSTADPDKVSGYDIDPAIDDAALRTAIKSAITNADGTLKDAYKNVASIDAKTGDLTFVNEDANLSAIQFVAKHFYGAGDDVYGNDHANNADMRTLADALVKSGLTAFGDPVTGRNGTASFDLGDDDLGLYLIVEGTHAANGETVSRAMVIGSPFKNGDKYSTVVSHQIAGGAQDITVGTVKLKADKVTVNKEVVGDDKLIGVGSTRTFQIDTNVPNYKTDYQNWKNPVFRIQDNPTNNLTVSAKGDFTDIANLKLEANTGKDGAYETVDAGKYTVAANTATKDDPNDFTVTLNSPADFSGNKLRLTYDATVNAVNAATTLNHTSIDFSNDPYTEDSVDTTPNDDEKLYQADLNLEKVALDNNTVKLQGAEFSMTDAKGNPVKFSQDGASFTVDNKAGKEGIRFGNNTDVTLKGIAADTDANGATYTFTETKAPAGYILGAEPLTFKVTVKPVFDKDGELTNVDYSIDAGKWAKFLDASAISQDGTKPTNGTVTGTVYAANATVENTSKIDDMPKTGADVLTYAASAIALAVVGAALAVAARRRMNNNK